MTGQPLTQPSVDRNERDAKEALLAAAEALLVEVGYARITVRLVAARARVNHGLVHYYFESLHELLLSAVERFTEALIARQRRMYSGPGPFIEKWRAAMGFLEEDAGSGYQKIWLELQAMSWNDPSLRERLGDVHERWVQVLSEAFERGLRELGVDRRRYRTRAVVSLVVTFNEGLMLEKLGGVDSGHRELLQMADRVIERLSREAGHARVDS